MYFSNIIFFCTVPFSKAFSCLTCGFKPGLAVRKIVYNIIWCHQSIMDLMILWWTSCCCVHHGPKNVKVILFIHAIHLFNLYWRDEARRLKLLNSYYNSTTYKWCTFKILLCSCYPSWHWVSGYVCRLELLHCHIVRPIKRKQFCIWAKTNHYFCNHCCYAANFTIVTFNHAIWYGTLIALVNFILYLLWNTVIFS